MERKYGKKASEKVGRALHEMKKGELKSGNSGQKVTSRKQAIAIGLSEAREEGDKVPNKKAATKKTVTKKSATKKSAGKKVAPKKTTTAKHAATKKVAAKKSSK